MGQVPTQPHLPVQNALTQCVEQALAETQRAALEGNPGDGADTFSNFGGPAGTAGGGASSMLTAMEDDAVLEAVRAGAGRRRNQLAANAKASGERRVVKGWGRLVAGRGIHGRPC